MAPQILEIRVNKKQADFLQRVCENEADYIDETTKKGWNTGFRATFQGGRGSGKTNVLMRLIAELVLELPKSKIGLASLTYIHVQNVVLSQSRRVWEEYGLYEYDAKTRPWGHYVIGKRPPSDWPKPLEGVEDYKNTLTWCNGSTIVYLSADVPELARGLSVDVLLIDESFRIPEEFYNTVLRKTVRANKYCYSDTRPGRQGHNHPLHWLIADFTSAAWYPHQQWIYRTEELEKKYPKRYFFMQATAYDNLEYLPGNFIENERESSDSDMAFQIEVLNYRAVKLPNAFYPSFAQANTYFNMYDYTWSEPDSKYIEKRNDYDSSRPIDIGLDFNAVFTSMLVAQEQPGKYNFIDAIHVKQASTTLVDQIAQDFVTKYESHGRKVVYVYGDNSGKKKDAGRTETYYDTVFRILRQNKWKVVDCVQKSYPNYRIRYQVINAIFQGKAAVSVQVNEIHAADLITSVRNAPIIKDTFEKDKSSETDKKTDQRFATHFSDIMDYMLFKKYSKRINLSKSSGVLGFR